jgi:hypothetical protein
MFAYPNVIANAGSARQAEHQVMSGIIKTTMLTEEQRHDMDGVIRHTIHEAHLPKHHDYPAKPEVHKVHPDKTRKAVGTIRIPGGKY